MRAVWVIALEQVCESHKIFKPTFPMEETSILDLEHAALTPYRMIKLLKAQNIESVEPYQTRIFRCREPSANVSGNDEVNGLPIRTTCTLSPAVDSFSIRRNILAYLGSWLQRQHPYQTISSCSGQHMASEISRYGCRVGWRGYRSGF